MPRAEDIAIHLTAEISANAWLERDFLRLFETNEHSIRASLLDDLGKQNDHSRAEIPLLVEERIKDYRGLITGRLLRPVLKHLYLLAFVPRTGTEIEDLAGVAQYMPEALLFHYHRGEFPQAFLRAFLPAVMEGDISKSTADKALVLISQLGLAKRVGCVSGRSSIALAFSPKLGELVEAWVDMKTVSISARTTMKKSVRRTTPRLGVASTALALLVLLVAGDLGRVGTAKTNHIQLASAESEQRVWGGLARPKPRPAQGGLLS